jgi:hypothetical protein
VESELQNNLDTGRYSGEKLSSIFITHSQTLLLSDDSGACRQKKLDCPHSGVWKFSESSRETVTN